MNSMQEPFQVMFSGVHPEDGLTHQYWIYAETNEQFMKATNDPIELARLAWNCLRIPFPENGNSVHLELSMLVMCRSCCNQIQIARARRILAGYKPS